MYRLDKDGRLQTNNESRSLSDHGHLTFSHRHNKTDFDTTSSLLDQLLIFTVTLYHSQPGLQASTCQLELLHMLANTASTATLLDNKN